MNAAEPPDLCFYDERGRAEVDLVLDTGSRLVAVEIKSGQTVQQDFFKNLDRFHELLSTEASVERVLIHGGRTSHVQSGTRVLPWDEVGDIQWSASAPRSRR